jgi:hypothetical protein
MALASSRRFSIYYAVIYGLTAGFSSIWDCIYYKDMQRIFEKSANLSSIRKMTFETKTSLFSALDKLYFPFNKIKGSIRGTLRVKD